MANLRQMLKQLRKEKLRAQKELGRLDEAITAFEKLLGGNGRARPAGVKSLRGKRKLSVAARKKIAAAQKARWAKLKAQRAAKANG